MKMVVVGAGAWGTALASSFARCHEVSLFARDAALVASLQRERENTRYLPGCRLPDVLGIESDLARAVAGARLAVVATPLAGLRAACEALRAQAPALPVVWACKGFESGTGLMPHQIVAEALAPGLPCGALTGPSFAAEVAQGQPTAVTLASHDLPFAETTAAALHQPHFRVYANDDLVGAEVGGAVKNVIAIAAGIAFGMGFGLNARAALMTRGLAEMARLGLALGGRRDTFLGLTGMGDLILTCTGDLSRNRKVGQALAKGVPLAQVLAELGHVAEGVNTTREAARLAAQHQVDMPITQAMNGILFQGVSAHDAVRALLTREPRQE